MLVINSPYKNLLTQIHPDANISEEEKSKLTTGCSKPNLPFICECGYGGDGKWRKSIKDMINKTTRTITKCKNCRSKQTSDQMKKPKSGCSLAERAPDIAKEFDHEANNKEGIDLKNVSYSANYRVWWICGFCKKKFSKTPGQRTSKEQLGCPNGCHLNNVDNPGTHLMKFMRK